MNETEQEARRVMTPLIGWPRLDRWLAEVRADAAKEARAQAEQEVRDYWDACGELIDTNNGARLAFDAIAAQINPPGEAVDE